MNPSLRVLVVEDLEEDVELLLHTLRRNGHAHLVYEAVDSEAALRTALELGGWDVITSDHAMPGFSAPQALALATLLAPDVPFIIVSSEIEIDLVTSLMRDGASDYVLKSHLPRLGSVVDRCLREAAERREHRRDLEALRASETRYRRLFESAQDGILIMDPRTEEITDANPFLIDMLGYPKDQLLGRKLWEIGLLKDMQANKEAFSQLQSTGYVRYDDLPLETAGGRHMDVEFVSNVYLVGGERVIQCNIRDVTERKQAVQHLRTLTDLLEQKVKDRTVQLEALNRELEAFSYSVSHDLRAPLRQVTGFVRILQDEVIDKPGTRAPELINRILSSVNRMNGLIDALLNLANHSISGFRREPVDLSALVTLAAAELGQNEPARAAEWSIAAGAVTEADAELLRIVIDNLLGNAWKFTALRVPARIEFGFVPQAGGPTVYFVRDNGAGFDMIHAAKMFGAFRRLHSSAEFPGSGIGLATVQRIIHRHGGRIWAEGAPDHGATFWFTLTGDRALLESATGPLSREVAHQAGGRRDLLDWPDAQSRSIAEEIR